jgi:two-component system nitrate/nitrite response regulator NarL
VWTTTRPDGHEPGISVVVHAHRNLFLETLTSVLDVRGYVVRAAGRDALDVADLVRRYRPDACILDATEDSAWLDAAHTVRGQAPAVKVLVLCRESSEAVRRAIADGVVDAALEQGCAFGQLDAALISTVLGLPCLPRVVQSPASGTVPTTLLTDRERQVLERLAGGATTGAIADALDISPHTVRTHLQSVMRKLEVHGRGRAVSVALAMNLVEARSG